VIKNILLRLDDTDTDDEKLKTAAELASLFDSHVTGRFCNVIPSLVRITEEQWADLLKAAQSEGLAHGRSSNRIV
jgi:hypothetical protein